MALRERGRRDGQVWGSGAIAAIVVCCGCGGRKATNFGGMVPLLGAIPAEGRVTTNFGGVDVVPLLGAHTQPQQWHPNKLNCLEFLADTVLYGLYVDNAKIGCCYVGSMLVFLKSFCNMDHIGLVRFVGVA